MNILRLPVVGSFLRWRYARTALQLLLLLISLAVVLHGLFGPQLAPRNLATVLTSIHWRGFLIVAIVAVGNLFCIGCPMVLARDVSRSLVPSRSFAGRVGCVANGWASHCSSLCCSHTSSSICGRSRARRRGSCSATSAWPSSSTRFSRAHPSASISAPSASSISRLRRCRRPNCASSNATRV